MIKAIITDFDGTLVDTFEANFRAYQDAFREVGKVLTEDKYRDCFGYRFDRFMQEMGLENGEITHKIKELKKEAYINHFEHLRLNKSLISLIRDFHNSGGKTAIASTARKENLINAVNYLGVAENFDLIFAGVDVQQGKPSPEIYNKTMEALGVKPTEVIIFEDSPVGFEAAVASGAQYIKVTSMWFDK